MQRIKILECDKCPLLDRCLSNTRRGVAFANPACEVAFPELIPPKIGRKPRCKELVYRFLLTHPGPHSYRDIMRGTNHKKLSGVKSACASLLRSKQIEYSTPKQTLIKGKNRTVVRFAALKNSWETHTKNP